MSSATLGAGMLIAAFLAMLIGLPAWGYGDSISFAPVGLAALALIGLVLVGWQRHR